ncbi:MAG: sodium:proton antiporter [Gammaproteobacteria bacterium]
MDLGLTLPDLDAVLAGPDPAMVLYFGALGLVLIGITGLVLSRHLFRMVIALAIAEAGANLLLVIAGYRWDAVAPIVTGGVPNVPMVDPVPQAMVLTAIVIGVGIQALALVFVIRIRETFGSLDMVEVKAAMEREIDSAAGLAPRDRDAPDGVRPLPRAGVPEGAGAELVQSAEGRS